MAILDSGGNYLYVQEVAGSFTEIGAPQYTVAAIFFQMGQVVKSGFFFNEKYLPLCWGGLGRKFYFNLGSVPQNNSILSNNIPVSGLIIIGGGVIHKLSFW